MPFNLNKVVGRDNVRPEKLKGSLREERGTHAFSESAGGSVISVEYMS